MTAYDLCRHHLPKHLCDECPGICQNYRKTSVVNDFKAAKECKYKQPPQAQKIV